MSILSGEKIPVVRPVVVLILTLAISSQSHADRVVPTDRVVNWVNVWSNFEAPRENVGRLEPGQSATLNQELEVPRYRPVHLEDGTEGFVAKSYTRVIPDPPPSELPELTIHFLDVGAGACAVVECPGENAPLLFYDCGRHRQEQSGVGMGHDEARAYLEPLLAAHPAPPTVVVSHAHEDHYNWIDFLVGNRRVSSIWLGGDPADYGNPAPGAFETWMAARVHEGAVVNDPQHPGDKLPDDFHTPQSLENHLACGLADTFILTVNTGASSNKSAESLVLLIEYESFRVIFPGDSQGQTHDRAKLNFDDLKTTVLAGAHHGADSSGSNQRDWPKDTDSEVVVYQTGTLFGHPKCRAVRAYEEFLRDTPPHANRCSEDGSTFAEGPTDKAEYVTNSVGTVVITTNGRDGVAVRCPNEPNCDFDFTF